VSGHPGGRETKPQKLYIIIITIVLEMTASSSAASLENPFVLRVMRILSYAGEPVKRSQRVLTGPNGATLAIDLELSGQNPRLLICRSYDKETEVPHQDVNAFKEILLTNDIPLQHGVFVSSVPFSKRSALIGIQKLDPFGLQLQVERGERRAFWRKTAIGFTIGLIGLCYVSEALGLS